MTSNGDHVPLGATTHPQPCYCQQCKCCLRHGSSSQSLATSHHCCCTHLHDSIIDKDHELQKVTDEVNRLAVFEGECQRKDKVLLTLRNQMADLQKSLRNKDMRAICLEEELSHLKLKLQRESEVYNETVKNAEILQGQLNSSARQISALQSQLSEKTTLLSSQCNELKQMKKEQRLVADSLASTQEEKKEKQAMLSSHKERVRRLQASNKELQTRLDALQAEHQQTVERERIAVQDASKLQDKSSQNNQLKLVVRSLEQQLAESKATSDDLACRLGRANEELCKLCYQLLPLVGLSPSEREGGREEDSKAVVAAVSEVVNEHNRIKQELEDTSQCLQEVEDSKTVLLANSAAIVAAIGHSLVTTDDIGTACCKLESVEVEEELEDLKDAVAGMLNSLSSSVDKLQSISSSISATLQEVSVDKQAPEEENCASDVMVLVHKTMERLKQLFIQCQKLEEREVATSQQEPAVLEQMISSLKQEHQQQTKEALERVRAEEQQKWSKLLDEAQAQSEQHRLALVEEEKRKQTTLQRQLEELNTSLAGKENKEQELTMKLEAVMKLKSSLEERVQQLEDSMLSMERKFAEERTAEENSWAVKEKEWLSTIEEHKVQCREHGITIVALEEKLLFSVHQCSQLTEDVEHKKTRIDQLEHETATQAQERDKEYHNYKEVVAALKRQLSTALSSLDRETANSQQIAEQLKQSEQSFTEEKEKVLCQHSNELTDLKQTLSAREITIQQLNEELSRVTEELSLREDQSRETSQETTVVLSTPIQKEQDTGDHNGDSSPLVRVGRICLGEKHREVIESQILAIGELRNKLSSSPHSNHSAPSHQASLRELARLRQQLSHMKAEQRLKEKDLTKKSRPQATTSPQVHLTERTGAHHHQLIELKESLQQSEETYQRLLSAVCKKLSIPDSELSQHQPMQNANKVDRAHIMKEREQFINEELEHAVTPSRTLRRKSQLHKDMSEPKQDKFVTPEVESAPSIDLKPDLKPLGVYQDPTLEILEQQKRLHQAVTKRQDFKLTQKGRNNRVRSHSCLVTPAELQYKVDELRKSFTTKLQQKSSEIAALQSELQHTQQQNSSLSMRLQMLQNI